MWQPASLGTTFFTSKQWTGFRCKWDFWLIQVHFKTLTNPGNTPMRIISKQIQWNISFYVPSSAMSSCIFIARGPSGNQTLSYPASPYLPLFLAAYWSLIQHTTFLSRQHEVLTPSVEYIMPNTCQIRSRSLQRIIETYHTHRISVKSPVLKIFIRIHSLMELLNLLRSRSPETTAGWHTVLQCFAMNFT